MGCTGAKTAAAGQSIGVLAAKKESECLDTWTTVNVAKGDYSAMGIRTKATQRGLLVEAIFDHGSVGKYNQENPKDMIRIGDKIVGINGVMIEAMWDKIWERGVTQLQIERPPRLAGEHSVDQIILRVNDSLFQVSAGTTNETMCAICLEEYKDQESVVVQLPCNHTFHPDCLKAWFAKGRYDCPLCKQSTRLTVS